MKIVSKAVGPAEALQTRHCTFFPYNLTVSIQDEDPWAHPNMAKCRVLGSLGNTMSFVCEH